MVRAPAEKVDPAHYCPGNLPPLLTTPHRTCPHRWPPASDLGTKKPAFKGHSNQTVTVPVATKCFNFNFSGYNVSYFQNMPGSWLSLQRYLPTWGKHVPSFLGGE